jgi:hypothetical protein
MNIFQQYQSRQPQVSESSRDANLKRHFTNGFLMV